jgi:hypothetical protein
VSLLSRPDRELVWLVISERAFAPLRSQIHALTIIDPLTGLRPAS